MPELWVIFEFFFFLPPSRSNGSWNPLDLPLKHIQNVPLLTYLPVSTPVEATISSSLNHCKYFPPWSSFYSCHPTIHCLQSTWSDLLRRQIRLKSLFCLKHLAASLITEGKKPSKNFPWFVVCETLCDLLLPPSLTGCSSKLHNPALLTFLMFLKLSKFNSGPRAFALALPSDGIVLAHQPGNVAVPSRHSNFSLNATFLERPSLATQF